MDDIDAAWVKDGRDTVRRRRRSPTRNKNATRKGRCLRRPLVTNNKDVGVCGCGLRGMATATRERCSTFVRQVYTHFDGDARPRVFQNMEREREREREPNFSFQMLV
jgi:hypothetical protein